MDTESEGNELSTLHQATTKQQQGSNYKHHISTGMETLERTDLCEFITTSD